MEKVFYFLAVLIGIIAIGLIVLSFTIDGIVKSNIEEVGSDMLNTSVEVDDVSISIFDGTGTIDGVAIENPEGFSDSPAMKLQQIHMKIDLSSLLSDTAVVDSIIINQPELFFEQKGTRINLKALTEDMDMSSSGESNLIIDYLLVEDGLVKLSTDVDKKRSAQVEFEEIELSGIGRSGSNTMKQTIRQVLEPIIERAVQQAIKEGLMEQAKDKLQDLLDM